MYLLRKDSSVAVGTRGPIRSFPSVNAGTIAAKNDVSAIKDVSTGTQTSLQTKTENYVFSINRVKVKGKSI